MSCRMNNGFPINQRYPENSWPSDLKGWLGETRTFSIHGMESMCCFTAHTSSRHFQSPVNIRDVGSLWGIDSHPILVRSFVCWLLAYPLAQLGILPIVGASAPVL